MANKSFSLFSHKAKQHTQFTITAQQSEMITLLDTTRWSAGHH